MEFMGKHPIETFHRTPKVNRGHARFVSVYYGWWAFTFLLNEEEALTPAQVDSAKEQCRALLLLEDDEDIRWKWQSQYRRASTTPNSCSFGAVTRRHK